MELLVTADDRTGAFETAAVLADHGAGPVDVLSWPGEVASTVALAVVDLGSRHLSPGEAQERLRRVAPITGRRCHKIDSTLRGNWPEELAALAELGPVLLIPALPDLGRTCVGGVVLEHGRPVHDGHAGSDVRRRITTSRPAVSLRAAGIEDVTELAGRGAVQEWLTAPVGVAVADAADGSVIDGLVVAWRSGPDDVALAGTSAVIGAAGPSAGVVTAPARVQVDGPILVACGSVHPATRAQLEWADRHGIPISQLADDITARRLVEVGVLILATEIPVGDVDTPLAVAAATGLARGVDRLRSSVGLGALVIIGGDTAAAVLGDAAVRVRGSVVPGTAWATVDGFDVPVITRSGGFGGEAALVDLVRGALRP